MRTLYAYLSARLRRLFVCVLLCTMPLALVGCGGGGGGTESGAGTSQGTPSSPPVAGVRSDAYFGYFGEDDTSLAETAAHVNLHVDLMWDGVDAAIARISKHRQPTMLGTEWFLYEKPVGAKWRVRGDAEAQLRALFTAFQRANVLHHVVALYPMDEPDKVLHDDSLVRAGNSVLRKVAAEFYELQGVKLAVIYGNTGLQGLSSYDLVGVDDYGMREGILGFTYEQLLSEMRPDQQLLLVPGGFNPDRQDPTPFVDYLESNPRVWGLIGFIWIDNSDGGKNGLGVRSNGMRKVYCEQGKRVLKVTTPCS